MTAQEYIQKNSHIIGERIQQADFDLLKNGEVIYAILVYAGIEPWEERKVNTAGYQMVISTIRNSNKELVGMETLALTKKRQSNHSLHFT